MERTKKLGLGSAVSVCVGLIVATSCLLSLGQGMGLAGKNFIIALFVVLILNGFLALSFSELHSMMPKAEGPGTVHLGGFRTGGIYGIYVIRLCDR